MCCLLFVGFSAYSNNFSLMFIDDFNLLLPLDKKTLNEISSCITCRD